MTDKQNVLLLTDVVPCNNYSGGIVSQQLCYFLLEEHCNIHCALLKQEYIDEVSDDLILQNIKIIKFKKPLENNKDSVFYEHAIKKISDKIINYITENNITKIWCPLQGESILLILDYIQKQTRGLRLVIQIWDPIDWQLYELKYSNERKKNILATYDKVIKNADYILTASNYMNDIYAKKYKVPCKPLFSSISANMDLSAAKTTSKNFTILLAGQAYAQKGINSLIKALEKMNWKYNDYNILLEYYGTSSNKIPRHNSHIICHNQISQDELIKKEAVADLLYCPYFFDDIQAYRTVSEQSFPSKVTTYIPSGTPILIHSKSSCPLYKEFKKYHCGFLLDSVNTQKIIQTIRNIIDSSPSIKKKITDNARKYFDTFLSPQTNKKTFLESLDIRYLPVKSYHILEVNNVDLPGRRWNGYDLVQYINNNTHHLASQICTYKTSDSTFVTKLYPRPKEQELEYKLLDFESKNLSVHSCLSCASSALLEKPEFKKADVVHLHLIHNLKLSLFSLIEICDKKPSIITVHDPWFFTGHCVHYQNCNKYLTGCRGCPNLMSLFPLKYDNCSELWKLKKYVYSKLDVDYVVTTKYMYDLFKDSPIVDSNRVHLIPFGINVDEFSTIDSKTARDHYGINCDEVVIFHRAQTAAKGTNYLVEALKQLKTTKKITILTCSEKNLLNDIHNKYRVIDLGDIDSEELAYAYNACDMYVMPSIGESFGMMAVEAMSCSKPVIVFDNTALPSVTFAPKCGIAVESYNSTKLMEAIKYLAEDEEERIRRGKLCRKAVEDNYRIEDYHKKIIDLYEKAAKRKHAKYYDSIVRTAPRDTASVVLLKKQLNLLTKKLFPKSSIQYKKMFYKIPRLDYKEAAKIEYSNVDTQLVLDEYNKNITKCYMEYSSNDMHILYKIMHKIKTLSHLLVTDRKKIPQLLKEKACNIKRRIKE